MHWVKVIGYVISHYNTQPTTKLAIRKTQHSIAITLNAFLCDLYLV